MIDNVLPGLCPNRAEALLWVRAHLSAGHRAIVAGSATAGDRDVRGRGRLATGTA